MIKEFINVPEGIRFLSDWSEFRLDKFPSKCIINKQIPGCGFTEYCIRSNENIILCSPRKILLQNKFDQHRDEVYLVVNEMDKDIRVDKDISKLDKSLRHGIFIPSNEVSEEELRNKRSSTYTRLYREIEQYVGYRYSQFKPLKILVTYDSYHIVVDILNKLGIYNNFYTVIDEFQSILHDARFKSDTELGFLNTLQQYSPTALFVSATPMMEEYLDMLDDFRDLPYFELDWYSQDQTRIIKPSLDIYLMRTVGEKAKEIIQTYLDGDFKKAIVMRNGKPIEVVSDEAVLYVNSVNHITSIIKRCGLLPDQVNILCSNTDENRDKVKKRLGKKFDIGSVPLRGIKPKMFTFCTRTVYLGADFYSTCARSFIFSDSNSDCLAVDISEDLPQILGRQRLFDNPWKNCAEFYYRSTADYRKMEAEDFKNIIEAKRQETDNLLIAYNKSEDRSIKHSLAKTYQENTKAYHYKSNYVGVNKVVDSLTGNMILKPVINNLVLVNEIRAFKIQQIDYADRFMVFSTVHNRITPDDIVNQEVSEFMKKYESYKTRLDKMRYLCECGLSKDAIEVVLRQIPDSDEIKSSYLALGPYRLRSLGYNITRIRKALGIVVFSEDLLKNKIYSEFKKGEKYTLSNLKTKLGSLYSSVNYDSAPRANDIESWFNVKEISIYEKNSDGSRRKNRGYELLDPR